ncbi:hypothetical protein B0T26DRAFT_682037 [Lasiosphaeria miniovina]|uniref:F-box domain-containing protein n=1 Tax=Lasiosphaeria miniovina TaxID=1954250 RepID=A0AA40DG89_9PEZI|nr:uncharacterized protein B0T26DRAFT_682037 [Lasiosphaeria miniovina]KAK0701945.1 hypothetical protein B0T26DRAFT_682037 [Lasiosphaeria miniovina]
MPNPQTIAPDRITLLHISSKLIKNSGRQQILDTDSAPAGQAPDGSSSPSTLSRLELLPAELLLLILKDFMSVLDRPHLAVTCRALARFCKFHGLLSISLAGERQHLPRPGAGTASENKNEHLGTELLPQSVSHPPPDALEHVYMETLEAFHSSIAVFLINHRWLTSSAPPSSENSSSSSSSSSSSEYLFTDNQAYRDDALARSLLSLYLNRYRLCNTDGMRYWVWHVSGKVLAIAGQQDALACERRLRSLDVAELEGGGMNRNGD